MPHAKSIEFMQLKIFDSSTSLESLPTVRPIRRLQNKGPNSKRKMIVKYDANQLQVTDMHPLSYNTQDLLKVLKWTLAQKKTARKAGIFQNLNAGYANSSEELETASLLRNYFEIFDETFFFNSLGKYCSYQLVPEGTLKAKRCPDLIGVTWHPETKYVYPGMVVSIEIERDRVCSEHGVSNRKQALIKMLEILLHEMAHAYFPIYVCNCAVASCETSVEAGLGECGHSPCWLIATGLIEDKCDELLGIRLDLGREMGVAYDQHLNATSHKMTSSLRDQ